MKAQYKLALMAAGLLAVTSCAKHDPLADKGQMGEEVPTCYWSVGSTACKAGESFTFSGQYYSSTKTSPDHSEVWYLVKRDESAAATVKLAGSVLNYTKTVARTDTVRDNQMIVSFPHSEEYLMADPTWKPEWGIFPETLYLDQYEITAEVPTSATLAPVDWKNVSTWDQEKFNTYYPAGFAEEFVSEVITKLTADSTYYNGLKNVYINYPFTNQLFAQMNTKYGLDFPTDIKYSSDPQEAVTDKSERWFETTEADEEKIVGFCYKAVDGNGNTVVYEVATDRVEKNDAGEYYLIGSTQRCYPVYASAPWVFCRYDDDAGAIVRAVRLKYIEAFKEMLATISFPDWIYDSAEGAYTVVFSRGYKLDAQFKVYDTDGNVGTAADTRTIELN